MEIEVLGTSRNELLGRQEVRFEVRHPNEPTPRISELRKALSSLVASDLEATFITTLKSKSGSPKSVGEAHVYATEGAAKSLEPEHVVVVNLEPSARQEALKKLAQRRAEKKSAVKKGTKQ